MNGTPGRKSAQQPTLERSPHDRNAEKAEFDQLVNMRTDPLQEPDFKRALDIARQTEGHMRSSRMLTLVGVAPPTHKRAMIAEALAETGAIDDRTNALEAICFLAKRVGLETSAVIDEMLVALTQEQPTAAVIAATNMAWFSPRQARSAWARCAVDAVDRIAPGSADSG
jgi:hypothetical protein